MKKIIFIAMTILLFSCTDKGDSYRNFNFIIKNYSGKDIVITSYNSLNPSETQRTITINNNSLFSQSYTSKESDRGYLLEDVFKGDSIIVNYNNNERKEIFTCIDKFDTATGCSENRNLLSYYNITTQGNNINTTYIFNTSDYDNAND